MRVLAKIIAISLITSCGGGGGGGGASTPPAPSVTVSGNKGVYRQDEPINITFTASNLDRSSISWSIANYDEESFKLDAVNGVFRNVETDFETPKSYLTLPAGEFSLTVTATDAAGKSASRAFQFSIDAVPTGFFIAREPNPQGTAVRSIGIDFTRDGLAYFESRAYRGTVADVELGFLNSSQNFICFGEPAIDGALVEGSVRCGGELPSAINSTGYYWNDDTQQEDEILVATEFNAITTIEFSFASDEDHDYIGTLSFFDASGALIETWEDTFLSTQLNSDGFSASNERLAGRYVAINARAQYDTKFIFYPDGRFNRELVSGSLILDVNQDFSFEVPPNQACKISGTISPNSISELDSINGILGDYFRSNRTRNLAANYSAVDCSNLDTAYPSELLLQLGEPAIDLSQADGSAMVSVFERYGLANDGEVIGLMIGGPGNERPFAFNLLKACSSDGAPTSFLPSDLAYICEDN